MDFGPVVRPKADGKFWLPVAQRVARSCRPEVAGVTEAPSGGSVPGSATIAKLTRRSDFLAARNAPVVRTPAIIVARNPRRDADLAVRVGLTVTKKLGGAVARNRIKRRLRAACRDCMPANASQGSDYILIARPAALNRPYKQLVDELSRAVLKLTGDAS